MVAFCRLTVVFLAFDVFFAIFCVALACVIGIALCCCLPCIIAILYAVAGQVKTRSCSGQPGENTLRELCSFYLLLFYLSLKYRKVHQMRT